MGYYVKFGDQRSKETFNTEAEAWKWADMMGLMGEHTCEVVKECGCTLYRMPSDMPDFVFICKDHRKKICDGE